MSADNLVNNLLSAPLSADWTVEGLAEQILRAIAAQRTPEVQEFVLDGNAADRQSQRIVRPLLACLAAKSAAEAGTAPNLYGGRLSFRRLSPDGPVWIIGPFENKPGSVRATLRRSEAPPEQPDGQLAQVHVSEK